MSLEAAMAKLAEAVDENNRLLSILTSKAETGLKDAGKAATSKPSRADADDGEAEEKPARRGRAAADADEGEPEEKPARRGRGRPAAAAADKPKKVTVKAVTEAAEAFLEVDDDEEYEDRRRIVKKLIKHFDVKALAEVAEEDRPLVLKALETAKAGDPIDYENL